MALLMSGKSISKSIFWMFMGECVVIKIVLNLGLNYNFQFCFSFFFPREQHSKWLLWDSLGSLQGSPGRLLHSGKFWFENFHHLNFRTYILCLNPNKINMSGHGHAGAKSLGSLEFCGPNVRNRISLTLALTNTHTFSFFFLIYLCPVTGCHPIWWLALQWRQYQSLKNFI